MIRVRNIPDELKSGIQHVCWRHEDGTKRPKIAGTLRNASCADPKTWKTFERCLAMFEKRPDIHDGIGRMFATDDGTAGIDLDGCRDPHTGELSARAHAIVKMLDSYTEVSPLLRGVKIWVRAVLPAGRRKKPGLEVYDRGRYFTLTGWHLAGAPRTVELRQAEIDALLREEFPEPERRARKPYDGPAGARVELARFLESAGIFILGEVLDCTAERVFRVICPWLGEHTAGDRSGTRVGQYADGAVWFRCEHAHCAHRGWAEFRDEVDPKASVKRRRGKTYARRRKVVSVG